MIIGAFGNGGTAATVSGSVSGSGTMLTDVAGTTGAKASATVFAGEAAGRFARGSGIGVLVGVVAWWFV